MNITNASDVTIKDVELTNAKMIGNTGSVLYINNANAKVTLENVYVHDISNTSTGAIYGGVLANNSGEITKITGLFENNTINGAKQTYDNVLFNNSKIQNIEADFVNNGSISTFVNNSTIGAIGTVDNYGTIDNIKAVFKGNYAISTGNSSAYAGALFNETNGNIGKISGVFIDNYAEAQASYNNNNFGASSGAIENRGTINEINADFRNNYTKNDGKQSAVGGAIRNNNTGKIETIEGNFENNYSYSTQGYTLGGAIYNQGIVTALNGNFENNYSYSAHSNSGGGVIYNQGTITTVEGNFNGNYAKSDNALATGGAINNAGTIINIIGNYADNYSISSGTYASGGAITNNATIGNIVGNYLRNHSETSGTYVIAGAIYNSGTIDNILGDFDGNYIKTSGTYASGGAIWNSNSGNIKNIEGNFSNNYVQTSGTSYSAGGAITNGKTGYIDDIKGNFDNNYAISTGTTSATGGAIYNVGTIGNITGDFKNSYVKTIGTFAQGGAIYVSGTIKTIKSNFNKNYAVSTGSDTAMGGAIENRGPIESIEGNFYKNYAKAQNSNAFGGAIENRATIGDIQGSFKNNYAETENKDYLALGGAVFTRADIQFSADKQTNEFSGNYTKDYRGKKNNAIFVMTSETSKPTITLNAENSGSFQFKDTIEGGTLADEWKTFEYKNQYNLKLKGDSSGKVYFNNDILNANIEHNDVTTYVDGMKYLNHLKGEGINSLTMNSGTLNVGSFNLAPLHFDSFGMNGGTINIDKVDVDLANKVMGRISANSYTGSDKGTINVKAMNVLSDGEKEVFADKSFKHTVKSPVKEAYTKLYRYDVSYDTNGTFGEDGYFVFTRGGNGRNSSDSFNPAVLTDTTAVQAGGQTAMNNVFLYAFEHADIFSQLPSADRFAKINSNKYAIASTDFNSNLKYNSDLNNKGVWVKPYSTFENIKLKNGPKVNTINYGTLVGFDSDFHKLKHGWANVATAYIGYSGSQMDYKGVDASMNSGLIGLTETFYKGNFWTALTATAGAGWQGRYYNANGRYRLKNRV